MLRQPLARLKIGRACFTPFSNSASVPGFTSICAISVIMMGPCFCLSLKVNLPFPLYHAGCEGGLEGNCHHAADNTNVRGGLHCATQARYFGLSVSVNSIHRRGDYD